MKKLHLVRPRRMRAVRQNLGEVILYGTGTAVSVPCSGPAGCNDTPRSLFAGCARTSASNNLRFTTNAPR
jgi:hypothetical protein